MNPARKIARSLKRSAPLSAQVGIDLFRGEQKHHAARARWAARSLVRKWKSLKRQLPDRELIVISLVEHFGDIVAAEPVARWAREQHPEARIGWVVRRPFAELVRGNPNINDVFTVGCLSEWLHASESRVPDRVIDLQIQGRHCPICKQPRAEAKSAPEIHMKNYFNFGAILPVVCRVAGIPALEDAPHVYIPDDARRKVDGLNLPREFIVAHCSSNQLVRDWTTTKWREFARRWIEDGGLPIVEVGLTPILDPQVKGITDLCGALSLLETAEVIRRARLFIGIDSGPAHLANAAKTPGVVLMGHYRSYETYCPYSGEYRDGETGTLIQYDAPAAYIPVDLALETTRERLARARPHETAER